MFEIGALLKKKESQSWEISSFKTDSKMINSHSDLPAHCSVSQSKKEKKKEELFVRKYGW